MQGFYVSGVLGRPWGGCGPPYVIVGEGVPLWVAGGCSSRVSRGQGGCTASMVLKVRFQFQWNSHTEML